MLRFVLVLWPIKALGFLLVKYCFYGRAYEVFKDNDIYQAINIESKKNPWSTSFLMNFMWIVSALKMYLIPLTSISIWQFIPFMIPAEIVYSCLFVLVGISVKDITAILSGQREAMTTTEKWSYAAFVFFTCLTFLFIGFGIWTIYKRVMHLKEQHRLEKEAMEKDSPAFREKGTQEIIKDGKDYIELPDGVVDQ